MGRFNNFAVRKFKEVFGITIKRVSQGESATDVFAWYTKKANKTSNAIKYEMFVDRDTKVIEFYMNGNLVETQQG